MAPQVAGVLLAAGAGTRFGRPKALAEFLGERLVDRGVAMLRDGGAAPVVVVTGAALLDLADLADLADVADVADVIAVHNPAWPTGMGSSLAAGLGAVPAGCAAAVIALVDQPLVGPQAVRRLIVAHCRGTGVAVAAYHGVARNPVLLAREHWPEVTALATGDVGARAFLRAHPELVELVECGDTGDPADVDTPQELARIAGRVSARPAPAPRNAPRSRPDPA